jgi:hypothetical protein
MRPGGDNSATSLAQGKLLLIRSRDHIFSVKRGEIELGGMFNAGGIIESGSAERAALAAVVALVQMQYHLARRLILGDHVACFYDPAYAYLGASFTPYAAFVGVFRLAPEPLCRL